ncbi:MAG: hypothetical protein HRT89_07945 [Lentisphaeria bacterium]|nr:GDSL-type esterase/lipase family protein [Lentisphaeria bacterium]NQZ67986.1 hypothetical protein [Lentisphaeria bacterium]
MKFILFLFIFNGSLLCAQKRGELKAAHSNKALALDLSDAAWRAIPKMPLGKITEEGQHEPKAWAKIIFGPKHIYVAVFCFESGKIIGKADTTSNTVWKEDSIELFLRPDPDKAYYQFSSNAYGVLYDAKTKDGSWKSKAVVKAKIDKDKSWSVVFKVPYKDINCYVGKNQNWSVNINRNRQKRQNIKLLEYSWAIMKSNNFHSPMDFGMISGITIKAHKDGATRIRKVSVAAPKLYDKGTIVGGVTVYHKEFFEKGPGKWKMSGDAVITQDKGVVGKGLKVQCKGKWSGTQLPLAIDGSKDLKLAFHAYSKGMSAASVNIFDSIKKDNTSSYGPRNITENKWTPILYHIERFHYNSVTKGYIANNTSFKGLRFFSESKQDPGRFLYLDNVVIYRGTDRAAPTQVTELKARATQKGIALTWDPAKDNVAIQLYVVSRAEGKGEFVKVTETVSPRFLDQSVNPGPYRYRVFAVDFEENFGTWSKSINVSSRSKALKRRVNSAEKNRGIYAKHVKQIHNRGKGKVKKGWLTLFGDSLTGATSYPNETLAATGMKIQAFGYPSMKTSFGKNKITEILKTNNPEIICVLYGTNNSKKDKALAPAMADMSAIIKACEANGTVVIIATIPPRGFQDPKSTGENNFNDKLKELATRLKVPVADIFEDIQTFGPDQRGKFISKDGVHWTATGMDIAGRSWGKALRQVRFVLRDQP